MSQPDSYYLNAITRLKKIVHGSLDENSCFNPKLVKDELAYMFAVTAVNQGIEKGLFTLKEAHKQIGFEYAQDKVESEEQISTDSTEEYESACNTLMV